MYIEEIYRLNDVLLSDTYRHGYLPGPGFEKGFDRIFFAGAFLDPSQIQLWGLGERHAFIQNFGPGGVG